MNELPGYPKLELNRIYCAVSGIKFYLADTLGLNYVAENNKLHPIFLDTSNLRVLLKLEKNKNTKIEKLYNKDWQEAEIGLESDFVIPQEGQILSKSFIAGIILSRLAALRLSRSNLSGLQVHKINLSLCKHRRRAQLIWWARQLCNWEKKKESPKVNLDTIWEASQGYASEGLKTKIVSSSIGSYLTALIEDDDSKLPRLRGRSQASVTVYDQRLARRARQRRAEKPLNGQHIDWGINKVVESIKTLKFAKIINKKQAISMEMCLISWADYSTEARESLGHKLVALSNSTVLKQDYCQVLERIGYAFVTGEIADMAKTADYTLAGSFLGETKKPSGTSEKKPSLLLKLRGYN